MGKYLMTIFLFCAIVLYAQTEYPHVQDNGGGYVESGGYRSYASIGQAVIGECSGGGVVNQAGYITGIAVYLDIHEKPDDAILPDKAEIGLPYPNPFNSVCKIDVALPYSANIEFFVYDLTGQRIYSHSEKRPSGFYTIRFQAGKLNSGVYLYTVRAGDTYEKGKIILVK